MTLFLALNIIFAAVVFAAIVGGLARSIVRQNAGLAVTQPARKARPATRRIRVRGVAVGHRA